MEASSTCSPRFRLLDTLRYVLTLSADETTPAASPVTSIASGDSQNLSKAFANTTS